MGDESGDNATLRWTTLGAKPTRLPAKMPMPGINKRSPRTPEWLIIIGLTCWLAACGGQPAPATPRPLGGSNGNVATESATTTPAVTPTGQISSQVEPTATTSLRQDITSTPGPSPTPSRTPTVTLTPSATPVPTETPTPAPQYAPSLDWYTPPPEAPTPVPRLETPPQTTNILLLGKDNETWGDGGLNSDSIILVSINRDSHVASMLSLPRDLYVYVPGANEMRRINTAAYGGIDTMRATILYNLGIEVHYFARVDFQAFVDIVNTLGGVDVAVTCPLDDWRLKAPGLDVNEEDSWEWFNLAPGIYHMDGDMALWYARSRKTTSDFDRGRRQQQILRAILNESVDLNLAAEAPRLWGIYKDRVETDLDIGRILQLAAQAPAVRRNGVQSLYLNQDVSPSQLEDGSQVQLPRWDTLQITLRRLYLPPALSSANRAPLSVEIVNASGNADLARLAAENLAWYGFAPVLSTEQAPISAVTTLIFNAPNLRGSFAWLISWIFDLKRPENGLPEGEYGIALNPDSNSGYDYRLVLGSAYDPCRPDLYAPQTYIELPTPTPDPAAPTPEATVEAAEPTPYP